MVWFWKKKTQQKQAKKSAKKPRSKTFILEEIISPGAYCPIPIDDSLVNHPIFGLFTDQELITAILGVDAPPDIAEIDTESLVQDYWEKLNEYFQENPNDTNNIDLENLSTWPTLEALINPGQPSVEIPDVGGAVDTLPPPTIVPVDPPRNNPGSDGAQEPVIDNSPQPPTLVNAISDITLTPETSSQTIDISEVFATPDGEQLQYEVISDNGELLNVNLENNQLSIEALPKTGESQVTIQATTESGGVAAHTFNVFNNYVAPESVTTINSGLTELRNAINANPDDLLASLDTPEAQTALETLATELESNFDNIFHAIEQPEILAKAGVSPEAVATLEKLLANKEVGAALGLPTSVELALANEDFRIWDNYLINATEAASILLPDAPQTSVAFLDFADEHGEDVTDVFYSVNPNAEYERLSINDGNWAQQLVQYVDNLKAAGEERGIANLSFDLTQVDEQGRVTTRYDLTEAEQLAIQYARDNNVLLVAASGNTGGEMSALGKAAEKFDNIITVGAVNKLESVADYSSRGDTLTLVAPGGQYENDPDAFVGTSRATSYVTGAASLVWAANPELSYQQVKELLTLTAKDLGPEGWDAETGAGLLDVTEAVLMAGLVAPEAVVQSGDVEISAFTGAGRVDVDVRAASPETEAAIQDLTDTQNQLLEQWQVLRDLGNADVTLEELQNEIAKRQAAALDSYQVADVAAAKSLVQSEQLSEAFRLAVGHHQIESSRLQDLAARQQQLQDGLTALTGERDELVAANAEQLKVLEEAIARTEQELDDARQKLQYQLVEPDTLVADVEVVKAEIAKLEAKIQQYRQQSAALKAQADSFYAQAHQYRQQQQHHTNIANNAWTTRRGRSGRRYTVRNTPVYNHHINIANQAARNANHHSWQGDAFQLGHHELEQLIPQIKQQSQALSNYQRLLETNNQKLSEVTGQSNDANEILEALQKQAAEKTQQAEQYWQQVAFAEERRKRSQDMANWHNAMINRWEVVGHRKSGKSRKPIHGWRHYPEHIAPRNHAQQQANTAEAEYHTLEQWARQAQTEADALNQQATALAERVGDWPELKRGIEYEINAKEQQLQGEKDLIALQTPVQQQQLETLELQIAQSEAELQKLEVEELPVQQQKTDATEERLNKVQEEVEVNQSDRAKTTKDLQNFLETYGYLLPYQERRAAVQKQIKQLEAEKARVQELLVEIESPLTPLGKGGTGIEESYLEVPLNKGDLGGSSLLEQTENYLNDIQQQLAYAKVQEEQLNLSAPESPQRLAIGNLISDLEKRQSRGERPFAPTLPLQEYVDFLRGVESRNNNLLNGFDDLEERLSAAQTQQNAADETLPRLQDEYRDLGLEKADIEVEKLMPSQVKVLQADIDPHQEILDGYRQQINDAHAVAANFEQQRQQHHSQAVYWQNQINQFNEQAYLNHYRDVYINVWHGWIGSAWEHYVRWGYREGRLPNPQAKIHRDAHVAARDNAAQQRDAATLQAQQLEASLQPNIDATETTIAAMESKQQIFKDIENIQPNATLEEAIALKDSQIANTKTAISQTQDTINSLENNLATTKQNKSDKEAEILGQEEAHAQTETDIASNEANITAKQAEISQQQSVLQDYQNQINQANAITNNFEQQRQQHEVNANHWNGQINTWGVTGHRTESYRYKSGKSWRTGYRQVPVYGWIYNPQAEANRDAELAAANNADRQRDLADQQAQELTATLQPQIEATATDIAKRQTDKQNLEAEKQNLQTQLSNQQQNLQNLQSELAGIEQNIGNIESDIATNEQKLEQQDAQLLKESSDKIYLQETLAEIEQRIADKESEISDKYEEIELTEKYARHVAAEIDRLSNRVKLLNEADRLDADYQAQEDNWKEAIATQVAATNQLLAARKEGEDERKQLLSLQSELVETQTELADAKEQQETKKTEIADIQEDLELKKLQLGNQQLQLQSLNGQDEPLRSAEAHYYNLAQHHRRNLWYWNGHHLTYHHGHAAAYRANLQKASRLAQQRNDNWSKIEETHNKINELNQAITTKESNLATKQSELGTATADIANLTAKEGQIKANIAPLVTALEPLQQQEAAKLQEFQNAVEAAETIGQQLATTTQDQADALNRLIGFGVLGTESDVDFFPTQVEAKVEGFIDELQNRSNELAAEADKLSGLITDWQSDLDKTTDDVSRQALTDLITKTIGQQKNLLQRQQENEEIVTELSDRLTAAKASLENLRQQQELEIRSQLDNNDERLEALNRQLETETAAEKAVNEDTVLAYAQLNDQVRADLTASATEWVSQLQEGHQQTQEIGEGQQNLSQSVDELIEHIENNLADVDGERDRNLADLRDAITTLGVVAPRRDELAAGETTLKQEIEKLKQWIEQDAKLWDEIESIADRYTLRDVKAALDNNLIRNGSFEDVEGVTGTRGWGALPAGWINARRHNNARRYYADTYSEDGDFGVVANAYGNFSKDAKAQDGSRWVAGASISNNNEKFFQKLETPLEPGKTYELSAYLKRSIRSIQSNPGSYEFFLADSTELKSMIPLGAFELTDSDDEWERRSLSFIAPEAAKTHPYIVFSPIHSPAGDSYIAIDNVSLTLGANDKAEEKAIPIAKSLVAEGTDNPADSEKLQDLKQHLQEFDRLETQQKEVEAEAAEIRNKWEQDVNFDSDKIARTEFDNKLIESVRGTDNMTYNRYSTDGGENWSNWQSNVMHSKKDDIKLVEVDGKLYQAVRHLNNIVYLRHSTDGHSWTPWRRVTNEVAGNFEIAAISNNLVLSVRAATNPADNKIYTTNSQVNGDRWSSSHPTPVPSLNDFSLENIDGKLVQSYLGTDNRKYIRHTEDGINWTQWQVDDTPEAEAPEPENTVSIQFKDKTFQATTGPDRRIYQRHSTDGGKTWTQWNHKGGAANEIKLVTLNDRIFQVVKGTDNKTYIRHSSDGDNWTSWNGITWATTGELEVDVVGDRLLVSVRGQDHKVWSRHALNGTQWSGAIQATPQTMTDMLQEVVDDKLVQSYRGMDNQIHTRHSNDGVNWSQWQPLEEAIALGDWRQEYLETLPDSPIHQLKPTRIEYGNQLVEAVRGPNNYLYGRTSNDNGETWSDWSYSHGQVKEKPKMLELNGKLYQFGRTPNDIVHLRYSTNGKTWTPWRRITNEVSGNYEVATIGNNLVLSVRASDNTIYTTNSQFHVDRWSSSEGATVPSINDFTLENIDGKLVQSYLGVDNNIYTRESTNGINWTEWESSDLEAKDIETRKEEHLKPIVDNASEILLPSLLHQDGENSMTIEGAIRETQESANKYGSLLAQLKAESAQNNAQAAAAIAQADWYEKRAAYHWQRSRKNGPTWTEQRKTWKRGKSGKKKAHWVTITHVDHDWIIWDTYTKYAKQLRQQGVNQLVAADNQAQQQERLQHLAEQWANANNATNAAETPITASSNLLEVLETAREQIPVANEQLQILEDLLPEVEQRLAEAQKEADEYNARVLAEWAEHDENATEYINTVEDILERRGDLNKQSQELQNQLADTEKWVEQQTVALDAETDQVDNLRQQLIADTEALAEKIAVATGNELTELQTKQAQLQDALGLLDNKAVVLREQQTAFSQKRTLLTAENEVILAEQRLLDAYLTAPDSDLDQLRAQLADTRAALAEAQRLAEQAEASSQALTAPLQEVQNDLLAQNDEHLKAAKEHQQILKELLEATELNANYTLEAAQKQQEVNDLEFQILQRLQEATAAGNQEAKHLLDVAAHNDVATAAEIYYRDYSDIASDTGGSCAGGIARPEDRRLADNYYREMQNHRQLQQRAQAQANHFGQIKETAQAQMNALSQQQETAAQMLQDINNQIAETQEQREEKEQELAVAQARLDGIARIRQQTEQTFVQLVSLEQLNLAQAQLEQQIAAQRQSEIEEEVARRIEREEIEIERQRLEARAKLEQLEQLQAEEDLRQAVNQVRVDVGLDEVAGGSDKAQLQSQMASLLEQLQNLEKQQPDLPDDVKALLADTQGDIHLALQGKEAENIQENLLKTTAGLIGQVEHYQTEIAQLESEELWDTQLLAKAQQDLQGASRELVEELERSQVLSGERDIIDPLYIETLSKVAYAEQAVDISQDLAKQSREMLEQIIDQRIKERKARKKYFWNQMLGTVSMVLGLISGVLLLFPPTAAIGGIAIAKIGLALSLVSGAISATQAAINGDWLGAIFSGIMSATSFISGGLGQALKAAQNTARQVWGMTQAVAQKALSSIKVFQSLASGTFSGVRSALSGDSIMGFLQVMGGLASAATSGINGFVQGGVQSLGDLGKFGYQVLESLSKAPTLIYGGIKAIESGDLVSGIGNVVKGIVSLTKTWTNDFVDGEDSLGEKVANALENISSVGVGVSKFITGGLDGLLDGLGDIIEGWGDDISKWLEEHLKPNCECQEVNKNNDQSEPETINGETVMIPILIGGGKYGITGFQKVNFEDVPDWSELEKWNNDLEDGVYLAYNGNAGQIPSSKSNVDDDNIVNIRFKTFIPSEAVRDPVAAYSGDNRTFSYESDRYRSFQDINLDLSQQKLEDLVISKKQEWGESKRYAFWEVEDTKDPSDPGWFKSLKNNATVDETKRLERNHENLDFSVNRIHPNILRVTFKVKGQNPVAAAPLVTPSIDANIIVNIYRSNTGLLYYTLQGNHDGFPAYELYLNGKPAYQYDPAKHGKTPKALFPPEDQKIKDQLPHILEN
ncbi:MAG: S8 family serine peptidase [Okeania sp. SIO3I5]|uniref:S8 family serine peptidase n=1 Tax=Okeania sp. SIO3I5 TaxID=2607805 RepID=UPI0013BAD63C|nr:S8 family serine peptidase [Okeania sp. SIO3I5]NEQ37937.1 S8 family serine peptidase [Okeania sp. SIO3I5]